VKPLTGRAFAHFRVVSGGNETRLGISLVVNGSS
jgi:hypothetical protein